MAASNSSDRNVAETFHVVDRVRTCRLATALPVQVQPFHCLLRLIPFPGIVATTPKESNLRIKFKFMNSNRNKTQFIVVADGKRAKFVNFFRAALAKFTNEVLKRLLKLIEFIYKRCNCQAL